MVEWDVFVRGGALYKEGYMKITDPMLPTLVMQKLFSDPDFHTVAQLVKRNTSGKVWMVGGKVYRTIIEVVHGYYCGAREADWDFLCMGEVVDRRRAYLDKDWVVDRPTGAYKPNSMCLTHYVNTGNGFLTQAYSGGLSGSPNPSPVYIARAKVPDKKIDIIGIKDIPQFNEVSGPSRLKDYFSAVPLDIQMIALSADSRRPTLRGGALDSVVTKTVGVNNPDGTLRPFDVHQYARQKANSIKFRYYGDGGITKTQCDCYDGDIIALWRMGCRRKDIHI
jgi:hypothetical protein